MISKESYLIACISKNPICSITRPTVIMLVLSAEPLVSKHKAHVYCACIQLATYLKTVTRAEHQDPEAPQRLPFIIENGY